MTPNDRELIIRSIVARLRSPRQIAEQLADRCGCTFDWRLPNGAPPVVECDYHRAKREQYEALVRLKATGVVGGGMVHDLAVVRKVVSEMDAQIDDEPRLPLDDPARQGAMWLQMQRDAPACRDYRPDHNGECLNCDEPYDAHLPEYRHDDDAHTRD